MSQGEYGGTSQVLNTGTKQFVLAKIILSDRFCVFKAFAIYYPTLQLCIITGDTWYQAAVHTAAAPTMLVRSLAAWGLCS